jgi:hypothetical protein
MDIKNKQKTNIQEEIKFLNIIYRTGVYALSFMLSMIPVQIVFYLIWPHPTEIHDWFLLFNENWFIGLVSFDFLYLLSMIASVFLYVAFFYALKDINRALCVFAIVLGLIGLTIYFPTNTSIEMLSISKQYMNANTEADKAIFIASGQTLHSIWKGTSYAVYYVLNGIALTLFFITMRKSPNFKKSTAYVGLSSGLLMLVPATAGIIGMTMALLSLLPWSIFSILVIEDFNKIIKNQSKKAYHES